MDNGVVVVGLSVELKDCVEICQKYNAWFVFAQKGVYGDVCRSGGVQAVVQAYIG